MGEWDHTDVLAALSGLASMNARAAEIRHALHDVNTRSAQSFRSGPLKDFMDTCEYQFKVYSRIQAVHQAEFDLSRGY